MSRWASLFYYTGRTRFESLGLDGKFRKARVSSADFPEFHGRASGWALRKTENVVRPRIVGQTFLSVLTTIGRQECLPHVRQTRLSVFQSQRSITHAATERISRHCQRQAEGPSGNTRARRVASRRSAVHGC